MSLPSRSHPEMKAYVCFQDLPTERSSVHLEESGLTVLCFDRDGGWDLRKHISSDGVVKIIEFRHRDKTYSKEISGNKTAIYVKNSLVKTEEMSVDRVLVEEWYSNGKKVATRITRDGVLLEGNGSNQIIYRPNGTIRRETWERGNLVQVRIEKMDQGLLELVLSQSSDGPVQQIFSREDLDPLDLELLLPEGPIRGIRAEEIRKIQTDADAFFKHFQVMVANRSLKGKNNAKVFVGHSIRKQVEKDLASLGYGLHFDQAVDPPLSDMGIKVRVCW